MIMLTDTQLAVYRPWVWIEIGDLKINYPEGRDEKFRFLKDFRMTVGIGAGVEFTIFDDSPQSYKNDWFLYIRDTVVDKYNLRIKFQWGVAGRDQQGKGIRGFPATGGFHASRVHEMYLVGVELEYVEGGINYKFTGTDCFAITQTVTKYDKIPDATFEEAVKKMITLLQADNILPKDFKADYSQEVKDFFPQVFKVRLDWPFQGYPLLLTLQKWMFIINSNQNIDKPDNEKVGWTVFPITIAGELGIRFITSNYIAKSMQTGLEIHINPPNLKPYGAPLGPGKHTAISFRPNFKGAVHWTMIPQLSATDSIKRSVIHSGDSGAGEEMRLGRGLPSAQPSQSVDSAINTRQATDGARSQVAGSASDGGSLFVGAEAEVELLGIPEVDEYNYFGNTVKMFVWNPAYLNIAGATNPVTGQLGTKGWDRNPPLDKRWPRTKRIMGISHYISTEGVYTTTLKLVPTGGGNFWPSGKTFN